VRGLRAFVSGRVQGVGYRAFTRSKAKLLGLKGFVRNLPDGRVEVYAEGKEDALKELLNYLRKGPVLARVDRVEYEFVEPRGEYEDFIVLC
jgi:acylphosphatase